MYDASEYAALRSGALLVDRSDRVRIRFGGQRASEIVTGLDEVVDTRAPAAHLGIAERDELQLRDRAEHRERLGHDTLRVDEMTRSVVCHPEGSVQSRSQPDCLTAGNEKGRDPWESRPFL